MSDHYVGTTLVAVVTFRDDDGAPADPTAVTFDVKDPDGEVTRVDSGDVAHPAVGRFTVDVDLESRGWWTIRADGTGSVKAADEVKVHAISNVRA